MHVGTCFTRFLHEEIPFLLFGKAHGSTSVEIGITEVSPATAVSLTTFEDTVIALVHDFVIFFVFLRMIEMIFLNKTVSQRRYRIITSIKAGRALSEENLIFQTWI